MHPEITNWILVSLFWLGLLVAFLGILMVVAPGIIIRGGNSMNKWISTDIFFNSIDRPRRSERFFYRYHHVFGGLIIAGTAYCLFIAVNHVNQVQLIETLPIIFNRDISSWLYTGLYYTLIIANFFALIIGCFVLVRPSLIKEFEMRMNRWIGNENLLRTLDSSHAIPEDRFPGNLRLFGIAVFLGGIFIMLNVVLSLQA